MFTALFRVFALVLLFAAGSEALAASVTLDFGSVEVNDTRSRYIRYTNNTGETMTDFHVYGGGYSFRAYDNCPDELAPGVTCTIRVDFRPDSPRAYRATISISSSAGTDTILARGWGYQRGNRR